MYMYIHVGEWISPETTEVRPPPCAAFSFIKVDLSRVVLFGGRQLNERVNELHILDMNKWVRLFLTSEEKKFIPPSQDCMSAVKQS